MSASDRSIVGDLINFRGLVYSPLNENGVIFLFGKIAEDLNMYVEEIKPGFPDCIARRFTGKGWQRVAVEFEYMSSNFRAHGHDPSQCDVIVCWEHDWPECPLEVIELRDRINELENRPIQRPDAANARQDISTLEQHIRARGSAAAVEQLYEKLHDGLVGLSDAVFRKIATKTLTYYCPERVFAYVTLQKTQIRVELFTRGEPIPSVKNFQYERGGAKWGWIVVRSEVDLPRFAEAAKTALERIREAIRLNEPTGWFASVEDEEETEPEGQS